MSGGTLRRVITAALTRPATQPSRSAAPAAAGMGQWPSRQRDPKITAERAIVDPTERSMPPVIMIGVIASASRPSSTESRTTSKKFSAVKKFSPMAEKIAISAASASTSTHSPLGKARSRQGLCSLSVNDVCMFPRRDANGIHRNRGQNDRAFDGALPIGAESQEGQRRSDDAEKQQSQHGAADSAAPARDRDAAHDRGGDHFELQAHAGVARDLVEADGVKYGGEARERAGDHEGGKGYERRIDSGEARGIGIAAGGV